MPFCHWILIRLSVQALTLASCLFNEFNLIFFLEYISPHNKIIGKYYHQAFDHKADKKLVLRIAIMIDFELELEGGGSDN